jgi:hypothetical protein
LSLHINRFIDAIKAAESRGQKDFIMSMRDAKDLHADITKVLLAIQMMREKPVAQEDVIQVEIGGGSFKN